MHLEEILDMVESDIVCFSLGIQGLRLDHAGWGYFNYWLWVKMFCPDKPPFFGLIPHTGVFYPLLDP